MCTASTDCVADAACVAGRCQPTKSTVKPAIDGARRVVVRPLDVGYARPGGGGGEGLPAVVTLGKDGAVLLLRFSVTLPPTANLVEAYVVLHRSAAVDDDPAPISLHATRIVEAWQGGSTSWARQPRRVDSRSPSTVVEPGGPTVVRMDVRELVRNWAKHDPRDQGIAVTAEGDHPTGTAFALRTVGADLGSGSDLSGSLGGRPSDGRPVSLADVEPYLELYLR